MVNSISRLRATLSIAAAACTLAVLLPPLGEVAGRYAYAEALQFVVLAAAGPALLVLGAPWRALAGRRRDDTGLADRFARSRSHRAGGLWSWAALGAFMLAVFLWRLPVAVDALARHQVLVLLELATLFPAGCFLWLELVASPPMLPRIGRPLRAMFAAVSMWTIWALAYIMGFSQAGWAAVYVHHGGHALSAAADQQIATGILWAVPAFCYAPVIYTSLITWLGDSSDPDAELEAVSTLAGQGARVSPRPPRGWRTSSTRSGKQVS